MDQDLSRRHLLLASSAPRSRRMRHGAEGLQDAGHRDDSCAYCAGWVAAMEKTGRFTVVMFDAGNASAFKRSVGVPTGFAGCHTAKVEGYVIEGHVPAADILSLIEKKPSGVIGLAVPGMPRGSPGMEQANGSKDEVVVWAFDKSGATSKYATYPERVV